MQSFKPPMDFYGSEQTTVSPVSMGAASGDLASVAQVPRRKASYTRSQFRGRAICGSEPTSVAT
jgi:hypothetical protein